MAAPELAQVIERAPYVKEPVTRDRVTGSSSWLASPASRPRNTIIGLSHAMQGDSKIAHGGTSVTMCDHQFGEAGICCSHERWRD
jgi:hypothetical protein